jgi:CelD/BcsL family acetyltransferase involved in cellulose biosynthesis
MNAVGAQIGQAQNLEVRIATGGVEILQQLAPEWRRLWEQLPENEPSYRPEWVEASLRAFFPDSKLVLISAWAGQRLKAVLPLRRERRSMSGLPVNKLLPIANAHGIRTGLVHAPGELGQEAIRVIWNAVQGLSGWNLIELPYVLAGSGMDQLASIAASDGFHVARKRIWQSLYLDFSGAKTIETPWMVNTRPKFRSNLRRSRRQLEEQGTLRLVHYDSADPGALERFYALESSGWKGKQGTAIACARETRQFYDEIAAAAAQGGYLSLDFLVLNETPIAANFALAMKGRYFLAKAGYDERYHRQSPGHLLVYEILSESEKRAWHELDFVGPATWDETRWAVSRRTHYRIFVFRKGFYGSLLHLARISGRATLKTLLGRAEDETADLPLLSQPQNGANE